MMLDSDSKFLDSEQSKLNDDESNETNNNENLEQKNGFLNSSSFNENQLNNGYCLDNKIENIKKVNNLNKELNLDNKSDKNIESNDKIQKNLQSLKNIESLINSQSNDQKFFNQKSNLELSTANYEQQFFPNPQLINSNKFKSENDLKQSLPTNEEINLKKLLFNQDDDDNKLFLSQEKSRLLRNQSESQLLNKKFVNKKFKRKSPKKQIIGCINSPGVLSPNHCVNINRLNNNIHSFHNLNALNSNNFNNQLNSGQFFITQHHSFTVMEESTDDEKQNEQEALFNNNDLNHITINSHENKYQYQQYLHQHFHHHPADVNQKILNEELITPTIQVQPSSTSLIALQQRRQLQQQQLQQRKEQNAKQIKHRSNMDSLNGLIFVLSAIYAKLIVILGLCFPMAEVISHRIPIGYYEGFYLYLYLGSIFYLTILYMSRESSKHKINTFSKIKRFFFWSNVEPQNKPNNGLIHENSFASNYTLAASGNISIHSSCSESDSLDQHKKAHYGSFYLRLGAVAFGIGSMIYSGLEFGQFFELENKEQCYSFLLMVLPTSHMVFTFFQLYFLFMNSKSLIVKHRYLSRFGLMHMIGTNLCVWLHVLIQETKHQIMILLYPNKTHDINVKIDSPLNNLLQPLPTNSPSLSFLSPLSQQVSVYNLTRMKRSIEDHEIFTTHGICRRSNVIGQLVMDASQFLFPCTIEYSLISAAILYIMWKNTDFSTYHNYGRSSSSHDNRSRHRSAASSSTVNYQHQKPHHYYQVDCAKASKGLFCGIFLLVVCIISLILFFVLIKKPNYKNLGMLQAHVVEIIL